MTASITTALPFGQHKGEPLALVPTSYLEWLLRACKLSSGLRRIVVGELARRGLTMPSPSEGPVRECSHCDPLTGWCAAREQDSLGRPRIKATCAGCRRFLKYLPLTPENLALCEADRKGRT
jgi:hypothetical protein